MKTCIIIAMAGLLFFNFSSMVSGEPFAPKVNVPKNVKPGTMEAFDVGMVRAAVVPDKMAVGMPSYPGAKVVQTMVDMSQMVNGKKQNCLPWIKLLSADPMNKIVEFYKTNAKGYQFKSTMGIINTFWTDRKDLNPMDVRQICVTPNITIMDINMKSKLMPEAITEIQIGYKP